MSAFGSSMGTLTRSSMGAAIFALYIADQVVLVTFSKYVNAPPGEYSGVVVVLLRRRCGQRAIRELIRRVPEAYGLESYMIGSRS